MSESLTPGDLIRFRRSRRAASQLGSIALLCSVTDDESTCYFDDIATLAVLSAGADGCALATMRVSQPAKLESVDVLCKIEPDGALVEV